jgi:uncharacterized protein YpuA (DUF1002 family)
MKIHEIKNNIEFNLDALYQKGFDLGWDTVLEDLEQMSDNWYNTGKTTEAETLRNAIKEMRQSYEAI